MKWLAAVLTFVNFAAIAGLLTGMAERGLSSRISTFAIVIGLVAALLAWWDTERDPAARPPVEQPAPSPEVPLTRRALKRRKKESPVLIPARQRYRFVWLWLVAGCFAIFAGRSFCWLLFLDGNEWRIQSPNNLGDLSLHITYIKTFASGVPLWPDNPIHVFSKLRYPGGTDLFNGLLTSMGLDVPRGLIWAGLVASAATCATQLRVTPH